MSSEPAPGRARGEHEEAAPSWRDHHVERELRTGARRRSSQSTALINTPHAVQPAQDWERESLFHQSWWLSIVTRGRFEHAVAVRAGVVQGRLPYVITRWNGLSSCDMPPFTRTLGPLIHTTARKHESRAAWSHSLLGEMINKLPPVQYFRQVCDPSIVDLIAFQAANFRISVQYTYRLDCRVGEAIVWNGLRDKTRNVIRRSQEKYEISTAVGLVDFIAFYTSNIQINGYKNTEDFDIFIDLYNNCIKRDCGEIISILNSHGNPVAMTFYVWDDEAMYYLLSTRSAEADNGAVSTLLWEALRRAVARRLVFDFDGVSSSGRARFLAGFGGAITPRFVVYRAQPVYTLMRAVKGCLMGIEGQNNWD